MNKGQKRTRKGGREGGREGGRGAYLDWVLAEVGVIEHGTKTNEVPFLPTLMTDSART